MIPYLLTIQPVPVIPFQPAWIFWIYFGMFIILAWVQLLFFQRFKLLIQANFSTRSLHQLIREGNLFNEWISIALSVIYVMSIAMVVSQVLKLLIHPFNFMIPDFQLFMLLCLAVVGFWALKLLIMNFLSIIFMTERTNNEYKLNILTTISFLGFLLLPILVFTVYLKSSWLIYVCLGIIILASLFRLIKGFIIGISLAKFSYFFLFVYLCTLEILPLLIAAKLIQKYF